MPTYSVDHIHLRSRDPMGTARYYNEMFDARIVESVEYAGRSWIHLDIDGVTIYIARAEDNQPSGPADPHAGLDHFGLSVDNLDEAVAELKERGAEFYMEPREIQPGASIAFVRAPDDVRIELLERR